LARVLAALLGLAAPLSAQEYRVGLVASDDPALLVPVPRDQAPSQETVLEMVRRAVDLVGGMSGVVADTARLVVIKPNIAIAKPAGSGVITDPLLVGAVALLVHEAAPGARILIAEGAGGWKGAEPGGGYAALVQLGRKWGIGQDGFAVAGYRRLVDELQQRGLEIDCFDLNYDRSYELTVPGGGQAVDRYAIAAAVMDADAWINCPVVKTHGTRITVAMKNHLGVLPGNRYGWSKTNGTDDHPGIPHDPGIMDEMMVDLWRVTGEDLVVVDGIVGHEAGALWHGDPVRGNWVLASRNPVAADLVASKLMGFNPDDSEFAELAWQRRAGPRYLEQVKVRGDSTARLTRRFKKAIDAYGPREPWRYIAGYGMGPRYWALLGPLPADHAFSPAELRELAPVPGQGGWSDNTFFHHDEIDLGSRYGGAPGAVYGFTYFAMARADSVRLWAGSDEGLQVWIDGASVYQHQGRRRHYLGQDQVPGYLSAGEHRLLVRAEQSQGRATFSFNICEPIDDPLYAGNRYPGVRYSVMRP
jgi:uncharacterized protein (DUF362 family)